MAVYYLDSSALVKLIRTEEHSEPLRGFLAGSDLVSCHIALTEVPRAIRRGARSEIQSVLLERGAEVLAACALRPLDRALLEDAGAFPEPGLRSLDAVHVAAALRIGSVDGFVTYDDRQAAAARHRGLVTIRPEDA